MKEIFLAVFQCCFFSYGKTNDKTIGGVISTVDCYEHLHQKMFVFKLSSGPKQPKNMGIFSGARASLCRCNSCIFLKKKKIKHGKLYNDCQQLLGHLGFSMQEFIKQSVCEEKVVVCCIVTSPSLFRNCRFVLNDITQ